MARRCFTDLNRLVAELVLENISIGYIYTFLDIYIAEEHGILRSGMIATYPKYW